jgi:hypothetical protein
MYFSVPNFDDNRQVCRIHGGLPKPGEHRQRQKSPSRGHHQELDCLTHVTDGQSCRRRVPSKTSISPIFILIFLHKRNTYRFYNYFYNKLCAEFKAYQQINEHWTVQLIFPSNKCSESYSADNWLVYISNKIPSQNSMQLYLGLAIYSHQTL